MRIIGVDGGLAHMGIADLLVSRDATRGLVVSLADCQVVETVPSKKKLGIRKSDDNMRRAREVARELKRHLAQDSVRLLVYEAQSFGMKGNIAARQAGTAFGVIAALAEAYELPMLCVTPGDIKKGVCPDSPKASKDDVIIAIEQLFPNVVWPRKKDNWEHVADAIAAAYVCRDDELVRAILQGERAAG